MKKTIITLLIICMIAMIPIIVMGGKNVSSSTTLIYFISGATKDNGKGDCILIYNDSKWALIDTGDKIDEKEIMDYLESKGVKELEFMILTHAHVDHTGNAIKILNNINVKELYIKPYDKEYSNDRENEWNAQNYNEIIELANEKNITIHQRLIEEDRKLELGDLKLEIYNGEIETDKNGKRVIYNNNNCDSLGILLTKGNIKCFLAGDINNDHDTEDRLLKEIGKVDILKLGHHGYAGSNTKDYMETLNPEVAIITNDEGRVATETMDLMKKLKIDYHYTTNDKTALILELDDNTSRVRYETSIFYNIKNMF